MNEKKQCAAEWLRGIIGEVDKVEMMRRAKALAKADSEARGVE